MAANVTAVIEDFISDAFSIRVDDFDVDETIFTRADDRFRTDWRDYLGVHTEIIDSKKGQRRIGGRGNGRCA